MWLSIAVDQKAIPMVQMPNSETAQPASLASPRMNSGGVEVVNGRVTTNMSSTRFSNSKRRSTRPNQRKEGDGSPRSRRSLEADQVGGKTRPRPRQLMWQASVTSGLHTQIQRQQAMATARTPSLNASARLLSNRSSSVRAQGRTMVEPEVAADVFDPQVSAPNLLVELLLTASLKPPVARQWVGSCVIARHPPNMGALANGAEGWWAPAGAGVPDGHRCPGRRPGHHCLQCVDLPLAIPVVSRLR
jgi:hypothetical protein